MTSYQRPGRRPGFGSWRRDALFTVALAVSIGLIVTRLVAGVSMLDQAQAVGKLEQDIEILAREVDREHVEVGRLTALSRIEGRALELGLSRTESGAVRLLASGELPVVPEARPLGAPGAGARGSWLFRVWNSARVSVAQADISARERAGAVVGGAVPVAPAAASALAAGGTGGEGVEQCEICRAIAAGKKVSH